VKVRQFARLAGLTSVVLVSSLTLAACGSNNNAAPGGTVATTAAATSAPAVDCGTGGTLNGEGSTAQKNAIEQAISAFGTACPDITVNYNATGSGAGVTQFNAAQVDFAGSDSALNAAKGEVAAAAKRCGGNPAWHLPMVTGPVAVSYNLAGVGTLILNGEVTAKIFKGQITTWNDPAIAALNPGVTIPAQPIHVFFRTDASGTTDNFTAYLQAAGNGVWTDAHAKAWPTSAAGEGRAASAGVAQAISTTPGGIGYVEWSYAKDNKLGIAEIDNGSGAVTLTADSVAKSVASAKSDGTGNDLRLSLDYATHVAGAYPIILVTYEIACSKGLDPAKTTALKAFLSYFASPSVQQSLVGIGYAPLPTAVQANVAKAIAAIS
jgi:phosphate transport system substrate-binding protein